STTTRTPPLAELSPSCPPFGEIASLQIASQRFLGFICGGLMIGPGIVARFHGPGGFFKPLAHKGARLHGTTSELLEGGEGWRSGFWGLLGLLLRQARV
ncbi:uncharacterized protein PgNI_04291, partial [Pyricularia grisea]|uniref:Uncharacterized protein n=1 Tax=Pyricularia grisea TaxID=148305 RepID=A0A6P8BAP9_PYRGI